MSRTIKTAVILVNLGTPDSPEPEAVRRYLREFLSDKRVVEANGLRRYLWLAILNAIIIPLRSRRVAKSYAEIWKNDSPMRLILNRQAKALHHILQQQYAVRAPEVFAAMTYGNPGLTALLRQLADTDYERLLIMPLYPQYSATTTAPIYDQVACFQTKQRRVMDIRILHSYYNHPTYIKVLADHIGSFRQTRESVDKLIFSYHGIPKEYSEKGDPYPEQCHHTSIQVAKALGLSDNEWMTTFQSRFGPAEWMQPYTDKTLENLPTREINRIQITCPSFSADCLETLEEVAITNRKIFQDAGGEIYQYITSLNDKPAFIELLAEMVKQQAADWLEKN